jgi:tRNA (adenine22-N1)-methyltransferase
VHGARIDAILSMIPSCGTAADIGTDHGLVALGVLRRGIAGRVIATDISAASLSKARALAEAAGVSNMETRLGDGLRPLAPGEADAAVLAGMGGRLIARILADQDEVARRLYYLILQPLHSVRDLRRWLYENRYRILSERLAGEGSRYYHVMKVIPGQDELVLPLHMEIGRKLIEERDPLLPSYLKHQMLKIKTRMGQIAQADTPRTRAALERYRNLMNLYREVLDETDSW